MTTYNAQVRVEDGMLHTSRPLNAPEQVSDMIESLVFTMRDPDSRGDVLSIGITIDTSAESDTPIADSSVGTTSVPIDADDGAAPAAAPATAGTGQ